MQCSKRDFDVVLITNIISFFLENITESIYSVPEVPEFMPSYAIYESCEVVHKVCHNKIKSLLKV